MTDEIEQAYLECLQRLTDNSYLSALEREALKAILNEYESYKQAYAKAVEE